MAQFFQNNVGGGFKDQTKGIRDGLLMMKMAQDSEDKNRPGFLCGKFPVNGNKIGINSINNIEKVIIR